MQSSTLREMIYIIIIKTCAIDPQAVEKEILCRYLHDRIKLAKSQESNITILNLI